MNDSNRFGSEIQRYLDGEAPADAAGSPERAEADRLLDAASRYSERLEAPGPEVDRAVMASIRARADDERKSVWNWLFQPHVYRVRPALAAAAVVVLVLAGVIGGSMRERAPTAVETAAAVSQATVP